MSSVRQIHLQAATFDPDEEVRDQLEIAHELTRFHRATMARRTRQIRRFLCDPETIAEAAALRPAAPADVAAALPVAGPADMPLATALTSRRSVQRQAVTGQLANDALGALLALAAKSNRSMPAPGVDGAAFHLRPYPSAGGLYPCEIYVLRADQPPCRYDARTHALLDYGQVSQPFSSVELGEAGEAPACVIVITGVLSRSMAKYGGRGYRFAVLEAGHLSQNLLLAAVALGLPALAYGSYDDAALEHLLGVDGLDEVVLAAVLIGGGETHCLFPLHHQE